MKNNLLVFGCLCLSVLSFGQTPNYEFRNGNWFNGEGFTTATWYVSNGIFSKKAPVKIDSVIDLTGKWVVPPFADAHCSSIADNPNVGNVLNLYLGEGVFYLQVFGNTQAGRSTVEPLVNQPGKPDAVFSNGGLTCSLGHPFLEYEGPASGIKNPTQWGQRYDQIKLSRKLLGDGYWFVDNKTALEANWTKIKAQNPGIVGIYLIDSEENGGKESKGLSVEMAKSVVKKAHKSGIRVYAHVESAADLRLGLKIGVDGFANVPGNNWEGSGEGAKYELTDDDLKKLAKKKTPIVGLFSHAQLQGAKPVALEAGNKTLKRMLANGVNLIIGSDDPQRTIRAELNLWVGSGAATPLQILKILSENTPKAIYPKRKIGKIEQGFEASFLVLNDDPLANLLKTRVAAFRMKQGVLLK